MPDLLFSSVPLDHLKNLEYRVKIQKAAAKDKGLRKALFAICKEDFLFWASTFATIYEPRPKIINGKKMPHVIPFIPWEHQIPAIETLRENLGFKDIIWEKSRGEGASWIAMFMAGYDFIFTPMSTVGLVSRNEETADSPNDPASLGWKIDHIISSMPKWMVGSRDKEWKRVLDKHAWRNLENGASIVAYAATENAGRAGRYTYFIMDELAFFNRGQDTRAVTSTQAASNSRLYISTPNGADGAFYEIAHTPSNVVKIRLHWSQNPTRNRGLYHFEKGKIVEEDPSNPLPENYYEDNVDLFSRLRTKGFNLEKGLRSPWYDQECDRPGATQQDISQELDIDYAGSKHLVFLPEFTKAANSTIRQPTYKGSISVNPETWAVDFEQHFDGQVLLWCELNHKNEPPKGNYVVSADVASGLGGSYTSNSVVEVIDIDKCEQVLEFATNTVEPSDFADICMGIAKWFHWATLGHEHGGPGTVMTRRVLDKGYPNIYRRRVLFKGRGRKPEKAVGWTTTKESKPMMFAELNRVVRQHEFTIRSRDLLRETQQYVMKNGRIEHSLSLSTTDDSSMGAAHGDRVIALAVGIQVMKDLPSGVSLKQETPDNPPLGTMAYRLKEAAEREKVDPDGWLEVTPGVSLTPGSLLTGEEKGWDG